MIIDLQKSGTWKIQLNVASNFISSKDVDEERVMHSKGNNTEFMTYVNANYVVDERFEPLLLIYQIDLQTSMRGSNFIFNSVQLFYYKRNKINFKHGGSYIESLDWIKNKKATINLKNIDDKCFQYAVTVALNN